MSDVTQSLREVSTDLNSAIQPAMLLHYRLGRQVERMAIECEELAAVADFFESADDERR